MAELTPRAKPAHVLGLPLFTNVLASGSTGRPCIGRGREQMLRSPMKPCGPFHCTRGRWRVVSRVKQVE